MAINTKLRLPIFLFFLLALSAYLALAKEEPEVDPELKSCKHQCRQQQQYSEVDKHKCMKSCEKYHRMKKERERQVEEEIRRRKEHEMEEKGGDNILQEEREEEEEEEEEECEEGNPFVFGDEQFETRIETDDGRVWVLQKFTEKRKLLRGIENFRLAILEAKEHTFVSPCHFDSEAVLFDVKGRATIGLVKGDKTERFNLEPGDIMRIPAGTPVYVVNRDENEKLLLAKLHITISIPGNFEAFYGPGGRDTESVLGAFSWGVLEASFKTRKEKLERLFEQQKNGSIFKISKEHVQALSKDKEGPRIWPFGGRWRGPFNLFRKRPSVSNQHGILFEVGPDDQRELEELNLMISFANITNGSMSAPLYYSKASKIALVIAGEGHFEMVTPRISSTSESSSGRSHRQRSLPTYQRVSARLRPGVVFVVPAGHPFVTVASRKNNLQILCFEVNARGNKKRTFAGKGNIVNAMGKHAKELSFNFPADKVDDIFNRDEQFFFPGPENFKEPVELGRAYA